ncbi:hypothetical protein [uncultured Clostridium sp.]|uniref:hypothetical protein n=1 Tax=uncultured Clostridium sp. TaxID=59620 RepID=UPI0025E23BFC|nr:hypothetical protein [uncultured Clostridium sp.]
MSPYYRYKKEKFLEKYQSAYDNLEDLKESISEYKKSNIATLSIFLEQSKDKVILKYTE